MARREQAKESNAAPTCRNTVTRRLAPRFRPLESKVDVTTHYPPLPWPPPARLLLSDTDKLRARYLHTTSNAYLGHFPINHLTHMLGESKAFDHAAELVIKLFRDTPPGSEGLVVSPSSLALYGKAVAHLNHGLKTLAVEDHAPLLQTSLILGIVDSLIKDPNDVRPSAGFAHRAGSVAIMQAFKTSKEFGRRMVATWSDQGTDINSIFLGVYSPLDEPFWLNSQPPDRPDGVPDMLGLAACASRLCVRIPGLICLLRHWRDQSSAASYEAALQLAVELESTKNSRAESCLLHRVRVVRTQDPFDRMLVLHAYDFNSLDEFDIAVRYWSQQLLAVHLYLILLNARHLKESRVEEHIQALRQEEDRLITCLLMCWQYAYARRPGATFSIAWSILIMWSALRDRPRDRRMFKACDDVALRTWFEDRITRVPGAWMIRPETCDLDRTAKLFVGGPLSGRIIQKIAINTRQLETVL
jgi:hypothetical protein